MSGKIPGAATYPTKPTSSTKKIPGNHRFAAKASIR